LAKKYEQTLEELRYVSLSLQQFKARLLEVERTLQDLGKVDEDHVYKAIGRLFIKIKKEDVIDELQREKELLDIKVKEFERKEKLLQERLKSLERQLKAKFTAGAGSSLAGAG